MNIARLAIERPLYTWLLILVCLVGGAAGYVSVGKLEDPVFTLKEALVITPYPGATAQTVAMEVSEVLESAVQRMDEIKTVTSRNVPGVSVMAVEVQDTFDASELPQVWDDLRDRIADAVPDLPSGVLEPIVNDSFADVFGIYYAVTAQGFDDADIYEIATYLRRELVTVPGVADVQLRGVPEEAIYVEPSNRALANLGMPPGVVLDSIAASDTIVPTGTVQNGERELSVEAPVGRSTVDNLAGLDIGFAGQVVDLIDIATIKRSRVDEPSQLIRHNGVPAFTLGIAGLTSENIVVVGERIEERLGEIAPLLPLGVDIAPIYEQHRVVEDANAGFVSSLALSVGIVVIVLAIFMGARAAVVVGTSLLLTVTSTLLFMWLLDIKVERISLGALIIAMGMLVDNAIVVAEGMQIEMRRGRRAVDAAMETARKTQVPLLGATIIGVLAFAGIGLSPDASGEFLFSLFAVIGISLSLSWLLAVTVTPLLSSYLFKVGAADGSDDPYDTRFFRAYASLLRGVLRGRWLVIGALLVTTVVCFAAFGSVRQQFFPPANTPLFYLDYRAAQGTSIDETMRDLSVVEQWLLERDEVTTVTSTIGGPLTRFLLTYTPEDPEPAYGQIAIRASSVSSIPTLKAALDDFTAHALPWAELRSRRIIYGPPTTADVEVRFSGPDANVLRELADEARNVLKQKTTLLEHERIDWRERELVTRPQLATYRAELLGLGRTEVAQAIALATDGVRVGTFRELDRLIPIIVRTPREELSHDGRFIDQLLWSNVLEQNVPLEQVINGFEVISRDTVIERRDRATTISVQADAIDGVTPPTAFAEVRDALESIELPVGYRFEWGGEYESSTEAQTSLAKQMPLSFGTMLLITVLLFGKLRQTAVIWTLVPMAVNGVALGLLLTGLPFSFTALLGLLSLSGMLIKNAIVLVEEIDKQKAEAGLPQSEAIIVASVSRLRPVTLAAVTTILGMAPLLFDSFFASMSVTIMAGLGFASILTLIGLPAIYHTYLRQERRMETEGRDDDKRGNALNALAKGGFHDRSTKSAGAQA